MQIFSRKAVFWEIIQNLRFRNFFVHSLIFISFSEFSLYDSFCYSDWKQLSVQYRSTDNLFRNFTLKLGIDFSITATVWTFMQFCEKKSLKYKNFFCVLSNRKAKTFHNWKLIVSLMRGKSFNIWNFAVSVTKIERSSTQKKLGLLQNRIQAATCYSEKTFFRKRCRKQQLVSFSCQHT